MTDRDDEAWRAIVENYGERPGLDDEAEGDAGGEAGDAPADAPDDRVDRGDAPAASPRPKEDPVAPAADESPDRSAAHPPAEDPDAAIARAMAEEEGFVPPPPPPLPYIAPSRLAAGVGVFGAPLVLLICVVFGISVPSWLAYLLVASFVGGFAYLVAHMRKRPDDPWDDGARV